MWEWQWDIFNSIFHHENDRQKLEDECLYIFISVKMSIHVYIHVCSSYMSCTLRVSLILTFAATPHTTKPWEHMSWASQALTLARLTYTGRQDIYVHSYPCCSLLTNCLNHVSCQLDISLRNKLHIVKPLRAHSGVSLLMQLWSQ